MSNVQKMWRIYSDHQDDLIEISDDPDSLSLVEIKICVNRKTTNEKNFSFTMTPQMAREVAQSILETVNWLEAEDG